MEDGRPRLSDGFAKEPSCQSQRLQSRTGRCPELLPRRSKTISTPCFRHAMKFSTKMEAEAAKRKIPIVGPAVGRILHQLALMIGAKTVFEMGSAIGYSTIWWARAVGQGGLVFYTDGDRKNADEARRIFREGGGRRRESTCRLATRWSFFPNTSRSSTSFSTTSIRKTIRAFSSWPCRVCAKAGCLSPTTFCGADEVAQKNPTEASTKAILEFNRLLYSSPDLFTTILPIRDGVAVAVKK